MTIVHMRDTARNILFCAATSSLAPIGLLQAKESPSMPMKASVIANRITERQLRPSNQSPMLGLLRDLENAARQYHKNLTLIRKKSVNPYFNDAIMQQLAQNLFLTINKTLSDAAPILLEAPKIVNIWQDIARRYAEIQQAIIDRCKQAAFISTEEEATDNLISKISCAIRYPAEKIDKATEYEIEYHNMLYKTANGMTQLIPYITDLIDQLAKSLEMTS